MKFLVEVSTPEVDKNLVAEVLEHELACSVHVEDYEEIPTALVYSPPEEMQNTWATREIKVDAQQDDTLLKLNAMIYVNGSKIAYRCTCGSNVFSLYKEPDGRQYYECHGCWTVYRGEKA